MNGGRDELRMWEAALPNRTDPVKVCEKRGSASFMGEATSDVRCALARSSLSRADSAIAPGDSSL